MDEQFNYLGETPLGTSDEWNWSNSFVTEEGLNIEYIDKADLEEKIAQGQSPEEMQQLARDRLGLVLPGEKLFYFSTDREG